MALDRQSIEKKDFPIGSGGYDPEAVDAHLASLADGIDELKRSARQRTDTLASLASEQVRAIVEAAETTARAIQREAEGVAQEIREEASSEAHRTHDQAADQAREYIGKVSEATTTALQRLGEMEGELSGLIESLRNGATRLDADLRRLEGELAEVGQVASPRLRPPFEPDPTPVSAAETPAPSEEVAVGQEADAGWGMSTASEQAAPEEQAQAAPEEEAPAGWGTSTASEEAAPEEEASPGWGLSTASEEAAPGEEAPPGWGTASEHDGESASPAGNGAGLVGAEHYGADVNAGGVEADHSGDPADYTVDHSAASQAEAPDDAEGARLIALNMALNGTPRDETARYLSDNFRLSDRDGLLDEVYASVEG